MSQDTIFGIDTAKSSFSLYGLVNGAETFKKTLTREKVTRFFANHAKCTVIMEACGGSHFWGREFKSLGHEVKLVAPHKVRPFRTTNKNDPNDAKATLTAGMCPGMEFVAVKEIWQQDILSLHRIRERHIANQTALVNEMRGLLGEYGVTIGQGINNVCGLVPLIVRNETNKLSAVIRSAIADMHAELLTVTENIERIDKELNAIFKANETCQRIAKVEGIGVITATAIYASCPDPRLYKNGRQFAAWLGLTPGHRQTGGKDAKPIMLGITKRGNPYIRKLLVQGGMSVAATIKNKKFDEEKQNFRSPEVSDTDAKVQQPVTAKENILPPCRKRKKPGSARKAKSQEKLKWLKRLIDEKGMQKAAVALANRNARLIWALIRSGETYDPQRRGLNVAA